ncbi:hypothetical protein FOZ62_025572, partial [Perkinsus olseni]
AAYAKHCAITRRLSDEQQRPYAEAIDALVRYDIVEERSAASCTHYVTALPLFGADKPTHLCSVCPDAGQKAAPNDVAGDNQMVGSDGPLLEFDVPVDAEDEVTATVGDPNSGDDQEEHDESSLTIKAPKEPLPVPSSIDLVLYVDDLCRRGQQPATVAQQGGYVQWKLCRHGSDVSDPKAARQTIVQKKLILTDSAINLHGLRKTSSAKAKLGRFEQLPLKIVEDIIQDLNKQGIQAPYYEVLPKGSVARIVTIDVDSTDDIGHRGRVGTPKLLKQRYFWHGMARDCGRHVDTCERCQFARADRVQRQSMGAISWAGAAGCLQVSAIDMTGPYLCLVRVAHPYFNGSIKTPTARTTAWL